MGPNLTADEKRTHVAQISEAKDRELGNRSTVKVSEPVKMGKPSKAIAYTHCGLTWKMPDGERGVKARFESKGRQNPDL